MTILALSTLLVTPPGHSKKPSAVLATSAAHYAAECGDAWKAVRWYRAKYDTHRQQLGRSLAPPIEQAMDCARLRERAKYWQQAAAANREAVAEWRHYHYAWWDWMPRGSKWYRVASCETGYGRDPNWAHDSGTYVSAFGIYRAGYADDAHRVGNLSWDETKRQLGRLPTPREQFEAALSHYRAHGGFSGWGCRGA